ncbi:hypothetical protein CBR_g9205 [Chara braunii]|uniref:DUF4360 domain-containing protein n=1 Tax=Chara braunii TaxID=69332 RepID=A0A388KP17_CHABU|nr:hypothetical protein CBR_g9205 [Chara braunii]|eukprot:GBG71796.1 hypothetical protein CBR_g9205 [Chara braunii]
MTAMAERTARSVTTVLQAMVGMSLLTLLLLSADVDAQSPRISSFKYNGNGCPSGTAVGEISVDGLVITMKYSAFSATTDQGVSGMRKSCQLNIAMTYSPGYSFSLEMVTLRGYTFLDDKVKATHKVSYYLTGQTGTGSFSGSTTGPFDDNYEHSGPVTPKVWSPCNLRRNLNVKAEVRVDNSANRSGAGFIDVDTKDVVLAFRLKWKTCK